MLPITSTTLNDSFPKELRTIESLGYTIYLCHLSDIPHGEFNNHVDGKNGPIDFYNVDSDKVKVVTYDPSTNELLWSPVRYWSKHKDREVVLVNLACGLQIITDDDPRAVYGIAKRDLLDLNLNFDRYTPFEAQDNNVLVPISSELYSGILPREDSHYKDINLEILNKKISTLDDAITCVAEHLAEKKLLLNVNWNTNEGKWEVIIPSFKKSDYCKVNDIEVILSGIKSIVFTKKKETMYDLTVPDFETFMNINGIILSNTVNVHVPGTSGAVEDVKNKLMPSKQIFSGRSVEPKVVNPISKEMLLGLWEANNKPGKKYIFNTKAEALAAIRSGKIRLNDDVEILGR